MDKEQSMIEYSEMNNEDADELIRFYTEYLNSGDMIEASIRKEINEGKYHGFKAVSDDRTAGFFTFRSGIVLTYPHPEAQKELDEASGGIRTETVDALMVAPEFRRRGLATEMAIRNREMLLDKGIEQFFVEVWIYPDGTQSAKKIYESMGRVIYSKVVPDFYSDSHLFGIECPICGKYCRCGAVLEIIDLTGGN